MRLLDRSQLEPTRVGAAGSRGWAGVGLTGRPQQQGLSTDAFSQPEEPLTRFSNSTDASGANPGISALVAPRKDLSRETRQNASAISKNASVDPSGPQNVSVGSCRGCGQDLTPGEVAAGFGLCIDCTEPIR
jgi:hypothetical protein